MDASGKNDDSNDDDDDDDGAEVYRAGDGCSPPEIAVARQVAPGRPVGDVGVSMQAEAGESCFKSDQASHRCLAGVNAAFLASGLGALLVSYMAMDAVTACLAVTLGLVCVALGLVGLMSQWHDSWRAYGVTVSLVSLLGLWISLVAWFRGDMALRIFEVLAASDWEAYFDTLEPSFRRQVLTQHAGCDTQYSGSCWAVVREHTAHKYFSAGRICVPAALLLAAGALMSLKDFLGTAKLVTDLDLGLNYTLLAFGVVMIGTASAEYGQMATWVGRSACWSVIGAGMLLMMIAVCSFLNRAGLRSSTKTRRAITTTSSSVLDACLFVLAQGLFLVAIGCFVAKHTIVKSLRAHLDDHALQDVLAEYQHIAGCDDSAEVDAAVHGFSCEASEIAWADAERVFRRQLDTIGWSLLLAMLLVAAKLLCGRYVVQLLAANAVLTPADEEAAGTPSSQENADHVLVTDGTTKGQYVAVSLDEEEKNGISRSSPIPTGQLGGATRSLISHQASGRLVDAIEEHAQMLLSEARYGEVTVEDLGDDYRGGMAPSDLLSQASIDSADITDLYGPSSGYYSGFSAADFALSNLGDEAGDDYGRDQLALGSRESSGGSLLGVSSPAVGRRGSLQLSIAEQSAWQVDLNRYGHVLWTFTRLALLAMIIEWKVRRIWT